MHLNGRCVLDTASFMLLQRLAFVTANQEALLTWTSNTQIAQASLVDLTYLLETQRKNHGVSQLWLPTATDHNLKAEVHQGFHFTLTSTRGERETNQRQYRIQRSGNIALHQQQRNFMGFTATEGQESEAATRLSHEPNNYISINNVEIVQATRAIAPHALDHSLHWWPETIVLSPGIQHCKVTRNIHLRSGAPVSGCSLMGYPWAGVRALQLVCLRIRLGRGRT